MQKTLLTVALLSVSIHASAITIITNISAGRKSHDCTGIGVCVTKTTVENSIRASWEWTEERPKILILRIAESALTDAPGDFVTALESGHFKQSDLLSVDPSLCSEFGTSAPLTIVPGTYDVTHVGNVYSITFNVREE